MKKGLLFILLLMVPMFVFAAEDCNYNKHQEYIKYAGYITYETDYNMGSKTFSITFYNVIDGLSLRIGEKTYTATENDTVVVTGLSEGTNLNVYIFGKDNCKSQAGNIVISLPYYNPYYGSVLCSGYEEIILCSSRFTSMKASEDLITKMKENYDKTYNQDKKEEEEEKEEFNLTSFLWEIFVKYISKGLLIIVSSGLTLLYFNNKMIKIEHGI